VRPSTQFARRQKASPVSRRTLGSLAPGCPRSRSRIDPAIRSTSVPSSHIPRELRRAEGTQVRRTDVESQRRRTCIDLLGHSPQDGADHPLPRPYPPAERSRRSGFRPRRHRHGRRVLDLGREDGRARSALGGTRRRPSTKTPAKSVSGSLTALSIPRGKASPRSGDMGLPQKPAHDNRVNALVSRVMARPAIQMSSCSALQCPESGRSSMRELQGLKR
jgi:hypothetical protein